MKKLPFKPIPKPQINSVIDQIVKARYTREDHFVELVTNLIRGLPANGISFQESVQSVAAHLHGMGKNYIEIGVDLKTKEIGWSFTALLQQSSS